MQRRDLLKMIVAATGTSLIGSYSFAYDQVPNVALADTDFTDKDVTLMNEVGELIIPKTDTPGAKEANVGLMMSIIMNDCYTKEQQHTFRQGLKDIDSLSKKDFGKPFVESTAKNKYLLINRLDKQAKQQLLAGEEPFFTMIKQLTIFTFFTSKIGATEVLRHVAIPGSYNGELPYKKGDKAWAR